MSHRWNVNGEVFDHPGPAKDRATNTQRHDLSSAVANRFKDVHDHRMKTDRDYYNKHSR